VKQAKDLVLAAGLFIKRLNALRVERFTVASAARRIQKTWRKKQAAKQTVATTGHKAKPRKTFD
jgi:hypothetical protein